MVSVGAFFVLTSPFQFTFLADDYGYLLHARQNELTLKSLGLLFARVPVSILLNLAQFQSGLWEKNWLLMYVYFAFYAFGVFALASSLLARLFPELHLGGRALVAAGIAILTPIHYEVLYWPCAMPYTVGCVFLALQWHLQGRKSRVFLAMIPAMLAFLTTETFLLPSAALFCLEPLTRRNLSLQQRRKETANGVWLWFAAVGLTFFIRMGLGALYGNFPYEWDVSFAHLWNYGWKLLSFIFLLHFFHATIWPAAVLEILAAAWMVVSLVRQNKLNWTLVLFALAMLVFSGLQMCVMTYEAPRAVFGATFLKTTFMTVLVVAYAHFAKGRARGMVLSLLAIAYLGQSIWVFSLKTKNAEILRQAEKELAIHAGQGSSEIRITDPRRRLQPDWVIPDLAVDWYIQWIKQRQRISPERHVVLE